MSDAATEPLPARKPRKGDLLEARLTGLGPKGWSVGRARAGSPDGTPRDYAARTRDGVPGDRVLLRVHRRRRDTVEGHVEVVLVESPDRVEPRCAHVESCGGCAYQALDYGRQLVELHAELRRTLAPLAALGATAVERAAPVVPSERVFGYRNKMDFTFGSRRWREPEELAAPDGGAARPDDFALGLHARGRFDKVLDVDACSIAFDGADALLATARREALARGLSAWDVRAHAGLLRHLVLRRSFATGDVLVDLVTTERAPELVRPYAEALCAASPEVATFVHTVNAGLALVAVGEEEVLHGTGAIEERLCGRWFRISARSFFQTNTAQAERLAALVAARADVGPEDVLYDVYCGGGALALVAGERAREVWGFELVAEAVRDAEHNAARNGVTNAHFVAGDVAATLTPERLAALGAPAPDVCVVDPPRAGLHQDVTAALARLGARRVVYVSCNPASAVRDLPALLAAGYELQTVEPLDLFPHTPHLECVFTLERAG